MEKKNESGVKVLNYLEKKEIEFEDQFNDAITLGMVKDFLKQNVKDGCTCPACTLNVELTPIVLTYSLIKPMAILYELSELRTGMYIHKDKIYKIYGKQANTLGKLTHWGFIVKGESTPTDDGNPNDGRYTITNLGVDFLMGKSMVNKTKFTFNKKEYAPPDDFIMEKVGYNDVMNEYFNFNKHVKLLKTI